MAVTTEQVESLQQSILESAASPKEVQTDMGRAEMHDLDQQLQVLERFTQSTAAGHRRRGLLFSKFVPPGTTS